MSAGSNDLLSRIKEIPTSQIIGAFYPLKKQGADYVGLCPFHNDSDPSMRVSDKKELFKCFACGAGGDSISFVQRYKNLEFKEALKEIGERFSLPTDSLLSAREKNPKYEMAIKVLKVANKLFLKTAKETNPVPYSDFLKKRELDSETVQSFSIGYAPGSNVLSNYLQSLPEKDRDFAIKIALEIGIIRKSQKGGPNEFYDTFRDRVTFPIWNYSGSIVGFGSRAVFDYQKGKYINSQESFVFNKRNVCYGLNLAKSTIRNSSRVFLTEGYMDCIAMVKNGFENTVAVMGVALGDRNVDLLSGMANEIFFALDSDQAGVNACKRMNLQFMKVGKLPRYLNFGEAKDPDEYLTNHGRLDFEELCENAPTFLDWQLQDLVPDKIPENTDRKLDILNKSFALIEPLGTNLLATERLVELAKKLGLKSTSDQIIDAYKDFLKQNETGPQNSPPAINKIAPSVSTKTPEVGEKIALEKAAIALGNAERKLLNAIGQHPECFQVDNFKELLDNVPSDEVKRSFEIAESIYFETDEKEYPKLLGDVLKMENLDLEIQNEIASGLFNFSGTELEKDRLEKLIEGLSKALKKENLQKVKKQLMEEQKTCESEERSFEILKEINKIQKDLNSLR